LQTVDKPKFLNSSLEQLFYDRERILPRFQAIHKELEEVEREIAFAACPYSLGQVCNYRVKDSLCKVIISKIEFVSSNPFYQIYLRRIISTTRKKETIIAQNLFNMETVKKYHFDTEFKFYAGENESISAPKNYAESLNSEALSWLIQEKIITTSGSASSLITELRQSAERGKSITDLGFKDDLKAMIHSLNQPFMEKAKRQLFCSKPKLR
jgi:hypothetical protein